MDNLTLPQVIGYGLTLGITFAVAAALADMVAQTHRPRADVFYDPALFLQSLQKGTP